MGIDVPELSQAPQLPNAAAHVWRFYLDLINSCTLSYNEIKAWSDLHDINLRSWELAAIMKVEKVRKNNG